jgi:hypothetical protein
MQAGLDPLSFLVISFAGGINQRQQHVIEYWIAYSRPQQVRDRLDDGRKIGIAHVLPKIQFGKKSPKGNQDQLSSQCAVHVSLGGA